MYDFFKSVIFFLLLFFLICTAIVFTGCKSNKILPDDGIGTEDFRNLQSEIRNGETELAVTGTELESTADKLSESIQRIKDTSEGLEQSIGESAESELGVGEILQRIRNRELPEDKFNELGIGIQE